MRLYSTPESALKGEITVLAICETVFCVALYVVVESVWHPGLLPWAVLVAPLLLARTPRSRDYAIILYRRVFLYRPTRWDQAPQSLRVLFVVIYMLTFVPISGLLIRSVTTIVCALFHPLETLWNCPGNWQRQALCTDTRHAPEIVPGEILSKDLPDILWFRSDFLSKISGERSKSIRLLGTLLFIATILPNLVIYSLSWLYRASFKATSLVYAPFVWIAHVTIRNPLQLKDRLERITKGEPEKVRRGYSWTLLTLLAGKIALLYQLIDLEWITNKLPSPQLLETIIQPGVWPWWQFALGIDALLTFGLFYFADAAIPRIDEEKRVWKDGWVSNTVSSVSFVRAVLAFLVLAHGFYFAWQRVDFSKVLGIVPWLGIGATVFLLPSNLPRG